MSAFLKQAESRAKIISKVIRQSYPDSLTQTTMSANTDRAAHCSDANTDFICGEELEDSDWQQTWTPGGKKGKKSRSFIQSIKIFPGTRPSQKPPHDFVPLEEATDTLNPAFFGKRRSIRTHQMPVPWSTVWTCFSRELWLNISLHHFLFSVYIHFVSPQTSHITHRLNIRDSSSQSQWCIHSPASPPWDFF